MTDAPSIIPVAGREPGIWLHMPAEEYHRDASIGSSGLKKLRVHPTRFFDTWAGNPNRSEEPDTPAKAFGRAVHRLVLEGERALRSEFMPEPEGEFPAVLRTMDDMKRLLRPLGFELGGVKADLIKRVKSAAPKAIIFDEVMDHARDHGITVLKPDAWARVLKAGAHNQYHKNLKRAFQGGMSEVSVFWQNKLNIRCKARFDYVRIIDAAEADDPGKQAKPQLMAVIADLKSFANPRDLPITRAVDNMVGENILQLAHYLEGFAQMRAMLKQHGPGFVEDATEADQRWLELVPKTQLLRMYFIGYSSTGAPFADATWHGPKDRLVEDAQRLARSCFDQFAEYHRVFGVSDLWINLGIPRHLSEIEDVRPWHL